MDNRLYRYRAKYLRNYDGDTIRFDVDLGLHVWVHDEPFRLSGIDTPEIRGVPEEVKQLGYAARDYVAVCLQGAEDIILETELDKTGKYGRYLATVWYKDGSQYTNLNMELVDNGLAELREY